jgi:hypothetical protein
MAYRPLTDIPQQFFDASGNPLSGGVLYAYLAGTSTPTNLYSDNAGTVAGASVTLDARGEPTTFKMIWVSTTVNYKFVLKDSLAATVWTVDNVSGDIVGGDAANITYTPAGTGAVATTVQAKLRESVSVKNFGAVGDGVTDDAAAIQNFINYCRDTPCKGCFPKDGSTYRIASGLVTQHNSSYAALDIDFNDAPIVADFSGSAALTITGGAVGQWLRNINIYPGASHDMDGTWSNKDTVSHGIDCTNSIVKITGIIRNFRGYGYKHTTSASNSNTCEWDLEIGNCNRGAYFTGTNDNISVCQAKFKLYGCAQEGFYGDTDTPIRQWKAWIYSENNCQSVTSVPGFYAHKATVGDWWIYAEQANVANEIHFDTLSTNNIINSARNNKDIITKTVASGNQVIFGGVHVGPLKYAGDGASWTPTVFGSGTAGTTAYTTQSGFYTRVGNIVFVSAYVSWTAQTGAGNLRFGGLPITGAATDAVLNIIPGNITFTAGNAVFGKVSGTSVVVEQATASGARTDVALDTSGEAFISGFYMV